MKLQEIQNIGYDIYFRSIRVFVNLQAVQDTADLVRVDYALVELSAFVRGIQTVLYRLGFRREFKQVLDFVKGQFWDKHPDHLERIVYENLILSQFPQVGAWRRNNDKTKELL